MAQAREEGTFDPTNFWRLYDEALPRIYGYLLRRSSRAVAEDLTQEVFSTAARVMATGSETTVTVPWLFTVAKSRLFDHFRAQQRTDRNLALVSSYRSSSDSMITVEESYDARHLGEATRRSLETLPPTQCAVLVLHHLDDLSVAEIADRIGRSVRATESLLARARRGFRSAFEEATDG